VGADENEPHLSVFSEYCINRMQVNSAQDYLTAQKRRIVAATALTSPQPEHRKYNYVHLSRVANGQSQYEKTPYPQTLSLAAGSTPGVAYDTLGRRPTINLCCYIPRPISLASLYAFTTFTFTPGAATGRNGPTLGQIQTAYSATSWTQNTAYLNMTTQGYQLWTVPATGSYTVTCAGAAGGGAIATNGFGIIVRTTLSLTQGQQLQLLVGQPGISSGSIIAAGGGGSFVASGLTPATGVCLVAAGGGGGGSFGTGITAQNAVIGQNGVTSGGAGGTAGGGGGATNGVGAGGGGFTGNGTSIPGPLGGGLSFVNGGLGGNDGLNSTWYGGFGGGGANSAGAPNAGGGGYSGGGGGGSGGGGGGSFPAGATSLGLNTVSPYAGYITIAAI